MCNDPRRPGSVLRLPRIAAQHDRDDDAAQTRLLACERQLRRAGLPTLIQDYSATQDIFTRALPFLVFVAVLEVAGATKLDWHWWQNLGAIVGGAALLLALFGLFNRLRGRPFTALPRSVGVPELTAFVVLPSLLPLVFGGQLGSAAVTLVANLVLVGLVWLIIGVGLFSIVRWAAARLFSQLAASLTLIVRALPLILFFGLLAFFAAEIWQIFSTVPRARYLLVVALFVAIGLVFLSVRLSRSVQEIEEAVDLAGTPLRPVQRLNLALVILVSQSLQIALVTLLVWLFFASFGALLVTEDIVTTWSGQTAHEWFHFTLLGDRVVVTAELVRAAGGIAAFSGLYYTVGMLVDATYRDEFVAELTDQMRSTFAVRSEYLELHGR